MMRKHDNYLAGSAGADDLAPWRRPSGVVIPGDPLHFLYIPDEIEAAMVFDVARQVHRYQREQAGTAAQITKVIMVTMGGLLPGVLLYDHMVQGTSQEMLPVEFGTVGVELYAGPGERLENPRVVQDVSIAVTGATVLVVDDLGDYGGTMGFVIDLLERAGAHSVLTLQLYTKPASKEVTPATFWFGEVPQDTWIITPRERVETLMKRVPFWQSRGVSMDECQRRLVDLIGYPQDLVDFYLPFAYKPSL